MAKQSGLGDNLYVDGYNLSGDVGSLSRIGGGPAAIDVTGIDKSANERIGGMRDGSIEFMAFFNDAASQEHPVLSALPTTSRYVTYCRGTSLGSPSACCYAKQVNYDPTRNADGSFTIQTQALSDQYGIQWGNLLTAGRRTDTAATNGTGVDGGASSAFGLQAFLHVFSFTGTSVTIKLQESSDNGAGDAFADVTGGAFTVVSSAPQAQRIATSSALSVERYLRVVTTGTFSSCTFAVTVVRNETAVTF